jgi:hypothetical protein
MHICYLEKITHHFDDNVNHYYHCWPIYITHLRILSKQNICNKPRGHRWEVRKKHTMCLVTLIFSSCRWDLLGIPCNIYGSATEIVFTVAVNPFINGCCSSCRHTPSTQNWYCTQINMNQISLSYYAIFRSISVFPWNVWYCAKWVDSNLNTDTLITVRGQNVNASLKN